MLMDFVGKMPDERSMFLYSHIYLIGLLLLFMIIPLMRRHFSTRINLGHKLFMTMLYLDIALLLLDFATWAVYGRSFVGSVALHYIMMSLLYGVDAVMQFFWMLYVVFKLFRTRSSVRQRIPIYGTMVFFAFCLLLTNPVTNWIFSIDEKNYYFRGDGYWLILVYDIIVFAVILVEILCYYHKYRNSHDTSFYLKLLSVPFVVILARVVQYMIYGSALTWPIFTVMLLYTYMNMQASENYFDYLTGLRNRRELDFFLSYRVNNFKNRKSKLLFLIYLDINSFKKINDRFGHSVGDAALVDAANILRNASVGTEDFIARMGGDEFAIVGVRENSAEVKKLIDRINALSEEFNSSNDFVYKITFSYGVSIHSKEVTKDQLLSMADRNMYRHKDNYKKNNPDDSPFKDAKFVEMD